MQNFECGAKWNAEGAKTKEALETQVAQYTALECQLIFLQGWNCFQNFGLIR